MNKKTKELFFEVIKNTPVKTNKTMVKTYFTFGQNHAHRYNNVTLDKDIVIEMETETHQQARERMFELFSAKWSFQYDDEIDMSFYPRGVLKI